MQSSPGRRDGSIPGLVQHGVGDAARTGTIGASFREMPAVALPSAADLIEKLKLLGLGGVLAVSGHHHQ